MEQRSYYHVNEDVYIFALSEQDAKQLYAQHIGYPTVKEFDDAGEEFLSEEVDEYTEVNFHEFQGEFSGTSLYFLIENKDVSQIIETED